MPHRSDLLRAAAFASFVCWLTVFPMTGSVLGDNDLLMWFLVPHVIALTAVALLATATSFTPLANTATILSIGISLLYVLADQHSGTPYLMLALGVVAAPLTVRMGIVLKQADRPILTAALGLVAGNLVAVSAVLGEWGPWTAPLSIAPLIWLTKRSPQTPADVLSGPSPGWTPTLVFIFFFQIVSGLMYGSLFPAYAEHAIAPHTEIVFYSIGALTAVLLLTRSRGYTLLAGVFAALIGFALWHLVPAPLGTNLGLFGMMLAAGAIDLFLLAYVLSFRNQIKAFGYGVSVMCAGIVAGNLMVRWIGTEAHVVSLSGLILPNLAVLMFHLPWKSALNTANPTGSPAQTETGNADDEALRTRRPGVPQSLVELLSDQERHVLEQALLNKTYKEVAETLAISESSVKTYMQRIFRKTGVVRRSQLINLVDLDGLNQPPETSTPPAKNAPHPTRMLG